MATPAEVRDWLRASREGRAELAILDAREEGEFGRAHPFWAVPCPLSRAELDAPALLPRRGTRVVCCDGGEGYAQRLAALLRDMGQAEVHVLEGGVPAWAAAGYEVFSGVNVPSKAFGEWVEHRYGTPSVAPAELEAMRRSGTDLVILDSRPLEEFRAMSIPGAVDVPGGELAYRIGTLAPDPATTVVVNCAGRTRSILGAESLRRAGIPNPVMALRDGTMGWELAGLRCDTGREARYPPGTPADAADSRARADAFAREHGVRAIRPAALPALLAEDRSTYLLDVRAPEEFVAGHLPGSRSAPGGQLVQATDRWVAVRGARIVLVDDTGTRARMTGAWLRQLGGWEVLVLDGADLAPQPGRAPFAGNASALPPWLPSGMPPRRAARETTPDEVAEAMESESVAVVELARSTRFRQRHVRGALWGVRTRLDRLVPVLEAALGPGGWVAVTGEDDAVAVLAAAELRALLPGRDVRVMPGGVAAWEAAGWRTAADRHHPGDEEAIDAHLRPYDRNSGQEAAMRDYLSWEVDLPGQVARDGDAPFGRW